MTVITEQSYVVHEGNGVATVFPYTFRITEPYMPHVEIRDSATLATLQVLTPSEYTITGVSPGNYLGGNVIYNPISGPLPTGQQLLLRRVVSYVQLLDLINQGGFFPETIEYALDMIVFQTQQLAAEIARTVQTPLGQPDIVINGVGSVGQMLLYDASGNLYPADVIPGLGDMVKTVYDPQGKNVDAFLFANMGPDKLALAQITDAPTTTFLGRSAAGTGVRRDVLFSEAAGLFQTVAYGQVQTLTPAQQGQAIANIDGGVLAGFRNKIINGDFILWQRGVSQSGTEQYGSDDRWKNGRVGSTRVHSQQAFTLGQTAVPGNPKYFSRTVVTSVAGASNMVSKWQSAEGVANSSEKKFTLSFWAKADAPKNMAVDFYQHFGNGGSPSAQVDSLSATKFALTTAWQKFSVVVDFPSVAGKTLGTAGDDKYGVAFWFDAGSNLNSRTASLGQQSGTFDIAHVSLVEGDATAEADPFSPRSRRDEEGLCKWFYERIASITSPATSYFFGAGFADGVASARSIGPVFPKRKDDACSFALTGNINISRTGTDSIGNVASFTVRGVTLVTTMDTTGLTNGEGLCMYFSSSGTNYLEIDCEI